ncbi:MAG: ATP synthase F0 subunit B [Bdellovibrionota bacterium]
MHDLIAPTVNFLILAVVLVVYLRKPVKEMILKRQALVKTQIEEAVTLKTDAEKRYREFDTKLSAFEAEASQIIERARTDGEALKVKIIKDAQATAERLIKDAEATVQANIQDSKDQIRRETIAKAVELAERMIREKLSSEDQRRIVNEYVGKVQ